MGKKKEGYSPNEGNTLSFALKLKNKNNGTIQTQIAKKAATSIKLGATTELTDPLLPLELELLLNLVETLFLLLASWAFSAKWKNQMKWSATTMQQESKNVGEVSEMNGQLGVKFRK